MLSQGKTPVKGSQEVYSDCSALGVSVSLCFHAGILKVKVDGWAMACIAVLLEEYRVDSESQTDSDWRLAIGGLQSALESHPS